jgi:hypothetical protein
MMLAGGGGPSGGGGAMAMGGGMFAGPSDLMEVPETPPSGCSPDAIKLFIGNIPKICTEEQLQPFFETIGKVPYTDMDVLTAAVAKLLPHSDLLLLLSLGD